MLFADDSDSEMICADKDDNDSERSQYVVVNHHSPSRQQCSVAKNRGETYITISDDDDDDNIEVEKTTEGWSGSTNNGMNLNTCVVVRGDRHMDDDSMGKNEHSITSDINSVGNISIGQPFTLTSTITTANTIIQPDNSISIRPQGLSSSSVNDDSMAKNEHSITSDINSVGNISIGQPFTLTSTITTANTIIQPDNSISIRPQGLSSSSVNSVLEKSSHMSDRGDYMILDCSDTEDEMTKTNQVSHTHNKDGSSLNYRSITSTNRPTGGDFIDIISTEDENNSGTDLVTTTQSFQQIANNGQPANVSSSNNRLSTHSNAGSIRDPNLVNNNQITPNNVITIAPVPSLVNRPPINVVDRGISGLQQMIVSVGNNTINNIGNNTTGGYTETGAQSQETIVSQRSPDIQFPDPDVTNPVTVYLYQPEDYNFLFLLYPQFEVNKEFILCKKIMEFEKSATVICSVTLLCKRARITPASHMLDALNIANTEVIHINKLREKIMFIKIGENYTEYLDPKQSSVKSSYNYSPVVTPASEESDVRYMIDVTTKKKTIIYKNLICPECGIYFAKEENLRSHIVLHGIPRDNSDTNPTTRILGQILSVPGEPENDTAEYLQQENQVNADETPDVYDCIVCGHVYLRKYNLLNHYQRRHDSITYMSKDGKPMFLFPPKKNLYYCVECTQSYAVKSEILKHCELMHSNCAKQNKSLLVGGNFYTCTACDRSFSKKEYLRKHNLKVHGGKIFECYLCCESYPNEWDLESHIKRIHGMDESVDFDRPFKCLKCNSRFASRASLAKHLKKSHNSSMFTCQKCPKSGKPRSFCSKSKLDAHMLAHNYSGRLKALLESSKSKPV